jgi:hypothetical protein
MKTFDVLFLERYVRQHFDFHGEQSEIGAPLDSMPLQDGVRDQGETPLQTHHVSNGVLARISVSMLLLSL